LHTSSLENFCLVKFFRTFLAIVPNWLRNIISWIYVLLGCGLRCRRVLQIKYPTYKIDWLTIGPSQLHSKFHIFSEISFTFSTVFLWKWSKWTLRLIIISNILFTLIGIYLFSISSDKMYFLYRQWQRRWFWSNTFRILMKAISKFKNVMNIWSVLDQIKISSGWRKQKTFAWFSKTCPYRVQFSLVFFVSCCWDEYFFI
jgi:hypothetical protein